jgi:transketolase
MIFKSTRDGFGEAMLALGSKRDDVFVVNADLKSSLRVSEFAKNFPERFIEVGVAEQNMIGVAAGLSFTGKTVFATSFASFSPAICWNQIRIAVCYSNANVKIVGSHAGLATGADGVSHQAIEDIAIMRVLPNMAILVPCDYQQAKDLTNLAAEHFGPIYLRLARPDTEEIKLKVKSEKLKVGGSEILREGKSLTIIGCGIVLGEAIAVAEELDAEVINCYSVKPLDQETIYNSVKKTGRVLTIEDHSVIGGLGSGVAELLGQNCPMPIKNLGVQDVFGQSARTHQELWERYGLDRKAILKTAKKMLR